MTRRKSARGKPGPKPGFQPAVNQRRAEAKARAAAEATAAAEKVAAATAAVEAAPVHRDPLQRRRQIPTMPREELNVYAKQIGVPTRDIVGLTDDRLRQNCLLTVESLIEAAMG